jgi:plastocyanin
MVLITIGSNGRRLYRGPLTWVPLATIPPPSRTTDRGPRLEAPDPTGAQRSPCTSPSPAACPASSRWPSPSPFSEPGWSSAAPSKVTIKGTAENKWDPADATVKPGGTVTFEVAGGATHPVVSGDGSNPAGDGRFDDAGCGLAQMTKVGDSCEVKFPKAGTFPFFCQVHVSLGMKGVITVGASAGGATTTTAAAAAGGSVVEPPSAAAPPSSGRPAIYWAGWGLFALGALLALGLIALYVRFWPGFTRPKS